MATPCLVFRVTVTRRDRVRDGIRDCRRVGRKLRRPNGNPSPNYILGKYTTKSAQSHSEASRQKSVSSRAWAP